MDRNDTIKTRISNELISMINHMSINELDRLKDMIDVALEEKKNEQRFFELMYELEKVLRKINNEFPNKIIIKDECSEIFLDAENLLFLLYKRKSKMSKEMEKLETLMKENQDVLLRLKNGFPQCPVLDYNCPCCLASGECILDKPINCKKFLF